jgi:catechol 2,3-dioxygenase-like lactoylglutathione lyase family enzyme
VELRACIDVDDLERGIDFYRRALGLVLVRRVGASFAELGGAGVPIDLLAKAPGTPPTPSASGGRSYGRHWTPVHLDFVVADIEEAVTRAVRAGATLERGIETQAFGRLAVLADPFGHGFCLLEFAGQGYGEVITE